jgi:hypothetical protein
MANTYYSMSHLGVDFDKRTTAPEFSVGAMCFTNDLKKAVYVQANGAVSASGTAGTVSTAGQLTDTGGAAINTTAFADDEYGWVLLADNT